MRSIIVTEDQNGKLTRTGMGVRQGANGQPEIVNENGAATQMPAKQSVATQLKGRAVKSTSGEAIQYLRLASPTKKGQLVINIVLTNTSGGNKTYIIGDASGLFRYSQGLSTNPAKDYFESTATAMTALLAANVALGTALKAVTNANNAGSADVAPVVAAGTALEAAATTAQTAFTAASAAYLATTEDVGGTFGTETIEMFRSITASEKLAIGQMVFQGLRVTAGPTYTKDPTVFNDATIRKNSMAENLDPVDPNTMNFTDMADGYKFDNSINVDKGQVWIVGAKENLSVTLADDCRLTIAITVVATEDGGMFVPMTNRANNIAS